jgi:DNA-binding XRE family transcriptional regulator
MAEHTPPRQDGGRIRTYRQRAGIKPAQLAAEVGVARQTVYEVEAGREQASVELLYRIAKRLDVAYEDLLSRPDRAAS